MVRKDTHEQPTFAEGPKRYICTIDYGLDALAAVFIAIDVNGKGMGYREVKEPNLTISQAANLLLRLSVDERIEQWLAPDDLWNRRQETGKSAADIFAECGINLLKVNRDLVNGCIAMTEKLQVRENDIPDLTFLEGTCHETIRCLQKIQKDKNKPTVYAKQPHDLTHLCDALRNWCVWWSTPARGEKPKKKKWRKDLLEDYRRASKEVRALMIQQLGEPY